jgi:LysM repeat protein
MHIYQPERKPRRNSARERAAARQRRQMATPRRAPTPSDPPSADIPTDSTTYRVADVGGYIPRERLKEEVEQAYQRARARRPRNRYEVWKYRAKLARRDLWWHISRDTRIIPSMIAACILAVLAFAGVRAAQGRIFPNIWVIGINLDNLTVDEAAAALERAWAALPIALVDGERTWETTAPALGLRLDARKTAQAARGVGLAGIPFGYRLQPVVDLDVLTAQTFLLDMTETTRIDPYNAGYRWEGAVLVGVPGSDGRFLDVAQTMERLQRDLRSVVENGRLELIMSVLRPEVVDPLPHLERARALAAQQFNVLAYDPFTDEYLRWSPDRVTFASWLEAGADGLTVREAAFGRYLEERSREINQLDPIRFLEQTDSLAAMRRAIASGSNSVQLRIRYRSTTYTIQRGDTGYRISRVTGIPFYQIQQVNPNRDWDKPLYVGEVINLPSRDITLPLEPVTHKRIIVNLDTQSMAAYENGQLVFEWLISSGMSHAPTFPGVYQILSHSEVALGSSYTLCSATGCGEWRMYWFMGIYETVPGLVNGFHGAVLLPNGQYLGGGSVGRPYTFGCVMSENANAEALYRWADDGTIVEIISSEFQPQSSLARQYWQRTMGERATRPA